MNSLFITHAVRQCGVKEHGKRFVNAMVEHSPAQDVWSVAEISSVDEITQAINYVNPDVTIINLHPMTIPTLPRTLNLGTKTKLVALPHENLTLQGALTFKKVFPCFSAVLWQDPTLTESVHDVHLIPRLIPRFFRTRAKRCHEGPLVKVFGFGYGDKQPELMVKTVEESFDNATIDGHFPKNEIADPDGTNGRIMINRLKAACKKNTKVVASTEMLNGSYMSQNDLIQWLADADINLCLHGGGTGIASTTDLMLAALVPFAVNDSPFFRHLPDYIKLRPGNNMVSIMQRGTKLWESLARECWGPKTFADEVNKVLRGITQ